MTLRATVWQDYPRIVEIFQDWPIDDQGPCTSERTRMHMARWFQQFHSYVWEVSGLGVVGVINTNYDYSVVTHAAIHPTHRGAGHFTDMTEALADEMINQRGIIKMEFDTLDQSVFIADMYNRKESRQGQTGMIHHAEVRASHFTGDEIATMEGVESVCTSGEIAVVSGR